MVNRQALSQPFHFRDIRFRIVKRKGHPLETPRVTKAKH